MGKQQKFSILSNELVRRLSNVDHVMLDRVEVKQVVEQYSQELRNSGYTGCPLKLWPLCFLLFLGFLSTEDKSFVYFDEAQTILHSKMSLL